MAVGDSWARTRGRHRLVLDERHVDDVERRPQVIAQGGRSTPPVMQERTVADWLRYGDGADGGIWQRLHCEGTG
jgi:hypothetical protein